MNFLNSEHKYPIILEECITPQQNATFKEVINKYHSYCKYTCSPTRRIYWLVFEQETGNLIGAMGLSSATLAISCRDKYIGWDTKTRIKNIGMLANNQRCCFIQKNITIENVGSMSLKLLGILGAKRWKERYEQPLIMLETYILPERTEEYDGNKNRSGSMYKASNWVYVGNTSGNSIKKGPIALWVKEDGPRGKLARENPKAALEKYGYAGGKEYIITKSPIKMMFIKPLVKNWKEILTKKDE